MCLYREKDFSCNLPPSYAVSIEEGEEEFLVGVFCERHSLEMEIKLAPLVKKESIPERRLKTKKLRFVSTECVRTCGTNWHNITH
jgi:hypothetical protein